MKLPGGREGGTKRVLIVDDDRESQRLLALILKRDGFAIVTAGGGSAALSSVAEEPPDLILLDCFMADMDGYEVAARLKGNPDTARIPIIMITAMDDAESRKRGLAAGIQGYIPKPIDHGELRKQVATLFSGSGDL